MIEVDRPILDLFSIVPGVYFNLIPDIVYKGGRLLQAFLEKNLKLLPTQECGSIMFDPVFMLLLAEEDPVSLKRDSKRYTLVTPGVGCLKMILVLLAKIVAFYMQVPIV